MNPHENNNENDNENGNDNENESNNGDDNGDNDEEESITEPEQLRKLFVGGLDNRTTDEDLKSHFEQYGNIVDVVVMKDPKTKRTRGFGFVTYSQSYMVDNAQNNRPHKIHGRVVEPKRAVPRHEADQPNAGASVKKLFVGGLRDDHDEECLREYFKEFGNITYVQVMVEKETGKKRGFAFVEFDDYDPVDKIILKKNHSILNKALHVQKAFPKDGGMDRQGRGGGGGGGGGGSGGGGGGRGNNRGNNQGGWGGNRGGGGSGGSGGGGNWGGNNYGNSSNFGGTQGGGGGGWNNQPSPWGNQGGGNDGWNSQSGYGGSGSGMGGWNSGSSFGNGYQQSYSGGAQRNNFGNNRAAPYNTGFKGGNQGGGGNGGIGSGNQPSGFVNNYSTGGGSGGGSNMGGGNRRY